jgi:hypothetical protein
LRSRTVGLFPAPDSSTHSNSLLLTGRAVRPRQLTSGPRAGCLQNILPLHLTSSPFFLNRTMYIFYMHYQCPFFIHTPVILLSMASHPLT